MNDETTGRLSLDVGFQIRRAPPFNVISKIEKRRLGVS
jgi:hypothetical protein